MKMTFYLGGALLALALPVVASGVEGQAEAEHVHLARSEPAEPVLAKSLVVISTWAKEKNARTPSEIVIKRARDDKTMGRAFIDNPAIASHFSEGWGHVNAFELEPGDYRVELYSLAPLYVYAKTDAPIRFTLSGGQKLYLGEAHFYVENDHGYLEMRDKSERDLPLFLAKNPALKLDDFVKAIPEPAPKR